MSDNRRLAKNSLVQYIKLFLTTLLGIFTSRFVLQNLGASDFGLYSVVGGLVVILNVLNMAIASSSYRFIAVEMGKKDGCVNKVFNVSLILHTLLALLILLLAETAGVFYIHHYLKVAEGKLGDALFVFHFSVFTAMVTILGIPYQSFISAAEKFGVRAVIDIVCAALRFIVALMLAYYGGNRLKLYAILMFFAWSSVPVMLMVYCRWRHSEIVRLRFYRDWALYREMIRFSSWVLLNTLSIVGWSQGTAVILNYFYGTVINSAYGIAKQVSDLIVTFTYTLNTISVPQIHKSYSAGNLDRTTQLVYYVSKYTFFLMMIPSLPVLLHTDFLLAKWLGVVPKYTDIFCQLTILSALLQALKGSAATVVHSTGKIKFFELTMSIIYLMSLPFGYFVLRMGFPPYSIFWVYVFVEMIGFIVLFIILKKLINFNILQFVYHVHLRILYVLCMVLPLFFIKKQVAENGFSFLWITSVAIVWLFIAIYSVGFEAKERRFFMSRLTDLRNRLTSKKE